jgi:hypothetical protein
MFEAILQQESTSSLLICNFALHATRTLVHNWLRVRLLRQHLQRLVQPRLLFIRVEPFQASSDGCARCVSQSTQSDEKEANGRRSYLVINVIASSESAGRRLSI